MRDAIAFPATSSVVDLADATELESANTKSADRVETTYPRTLLPEPLQPPRAINQRDRGQTIHNPVVRTLQA